MTPSVSTEPTYLTLPNGRSLEYLGALDNGGRTFDRYHAGFECAPDDENGPSSFGLDIGPTGNHPQGVCMSTEIFFEDSGEPIAWESLPAPVQRAIWNEFQLFENTNGYASS